MPSQGTVSVKVDLDSTRLEQMLAVIAKHSQALADELAALREGDED